jgi:hypothetical protein
VRYPRHQIATHIPGVDNIPADNKLDTFFCFFPKGTTATHQHTTGALGSSGGNPTRLAISRLDGKAQNLLRKGITQSTEKVYLSAHRGYLLFCQHLNLQPLPATEDTLILYVTELAQTRAHSTIKTYLAGVRHLHVINGLGNPLEGKLKLNLVLKGIKPRM